MIDVIILMYYICVNFWFRSYSAVELMNFRLKYRLLFYFYEINIIRLKSGLRTKLNVFKMTIFNPHD